ncbi:BglG family transcription antiterminator [Clostridium transplantifaecale]|uniref:BglG family transcription antiterminator n=1 Tax=Clostridium transplantifaecale TaxID=2479838 RepID=UPI000F63B84A|nr:BglG family transcription antiterminator [Clostridium transplantifaecale]
MDFTPRMQQILRIMLNEDKVISVKNLAEQMKLSKRTVQRELEYLGKALKEYNVTFCSKTGTGVWLEGEAEDKERLYHQLSEKDTLDVSDRTERRKRLLLEILKDKTLKKLYYYSDLFGVSEATISADLEAAEEWFAPFNLKINRKPGYGISIEGREKDFRLALRSFIDENIDTRFIRDIYEEKDQALFELVENKNDKNIYKILNNDLLLRVIACIQRVKDRRLLNLTENSYVGLVLHVTIAVNRILGKEILEENEAMVKSLYGDEDYRLAGRIVEELRKEFEIEIPEIEVAYVCLHIKGAKVQQIELDEDSKARVSGQRELLSVVNAMIDRFDPAVAWQLKQDEEFVVQGLAAHLQPTLVRLANNMKIENPLLEQIKNDYAAIFERCRDVAEVIEEHYGFTVPEPEIGYLAIHFGAAMVRLESRKEVKRKVNMGVVCASGIGISRLMCSRINKFFKERIELTAYGVNDLNPFALEHTDFFVSTLPVRENADILYVSPLLTSQEMEQIAARVREYERMPAAGKENEAFTRQLEEVNYLATQIKSLIKRFRRTKIGTAATFGELLLKAGEEQTPYADRQTMIIEALKRRETMGSQFFPDYSFALLHARTAGVTKPVFTAFVPESGERFTAPDMKGIRAAIVMLMPEEGHTQENADMLGYLSQMLVEKDEFLDTIITKEEEDVRDLLSRYLKKYFDQYLDRM